MGHEIAGASVPLAYGRKRLTRRLWYWVAAGVAGLGAAGWVTRPFVEPAWRQGMHLQQQRRISHQVLPAETVIFTEDPARIASLRGRAGYRDAADRGYARSPGLPPAWERIWNSYNFEERSAGALTRIQLDDTFCHERISAGGIRWIVNLSQVNPWLQPDGRRNVGLCQAALTPAGWSVGSRGTSVSTMSDQIRVGPADVVTLFAPRLDPVAADRVTVGYEVNGRPGVLAGTVQENGHVRFAVVSGPGRLVPWNTP